MNPEYTATISCWQAVSTLDHRTATLSFLVAYLGLGPQQETHIRLSPA